MDRRQQQAELIFSLGKLFGPLIEMSENPSNFESWERVRTLARFSSNHPSFTQSVNLFLSSEPGHTYQIEMTRFSPLINLMMSQIEREPEDNENLHSAVTIARDKMLKIILSIPIPSSAQILDAYTPFSTYCLIKDKCSTSAQNIIWVDRYFDSSLFYRYLRNIPENTFITIVTWPEEKFRGKKEKERYKELLDISALFAKERTNDKYQLVCNEKIHDRWLNIDKHIYNLGGSVKDASIKDYFTVSTIDYTKDNIEKINELVNTGTKV